MKKQPEFPELVRDMEIVKSLNRKTRAGETANGKEINDTQDVSNGASS